MKRIWLPFKVGMNHRRSISIKFYIFLTLVLAQFVQYGYAIGPSLPLEFQERGEQKGAWEVVLRTDSKQIRLVVLERQIFANGERLRAEVIEPFVGRPSQDRGETIFVIPLRFKGIEDLAAGVYAQKIVATGRWLTTSSNKDLYQQRWFYFTVSEESIQQIDSEQYSELVDKTEVMNDGHGQRVLSQRGVELRTTVPLLQTKATFDIPVGPFGGAMPERPPEEVNRLEQESDRSETNEN